MEDYNDFIKRENEERLQITKSHFNRDDFIFGGIINIMGVSSIWGYVLHVNRFSSWYTIHSNLLVDEDVSENYTTMMIYDTTNKITSETILPTIEISVKYYIVRHRLDIIK